MRKIKLKELKICEIKYKRDSLIINKNSVKIDDLNVRPDTVKCQEENIRGKLLTLALAMIFRFDTKSKCSESKSEQ